MFIQNIAEEIDGVSNAIDTDILAYTCPADTNAIQGTIICNNFGNIVADIRIYNVPSGQSIGDEYRCTPDVDVSPDAQYNFQIPVCMEAGDRIYVRSGVIDVNFIGWCEEKAV